MTLDKIKLTQVRRCVCGTFLQWDLSIYWYPRTVLIRTLSKASLLSPIFFDCIKILQKFQKVSSNSHKLMEKQKTNKNHECKLMNVIKNSISYHVKQTPGKYIYLRQLKLFSIFFKNKFDLISVILYVVQITTIQSINVYHEKIFKQTTFV